MSRVTIDAVLSETLANLSTPVELCDPKGRIVGTFVRAAEWEPVDPLEPEPTDAELDHRIATDRRFTTAEVLAHLESL